MRWLEWTDGLCEQSPRYRSVIDRLRREAARGLEGRPLTAYSLDALWRRREEAVSAADADPANYKGSWGRRNGWELDPTRSPLEYVERYVVAVHEVARRFHGSPPRWCPDSPAWRRPGSAFLADAVHELVGREGYQLRIRVSLDWPAPTGGAASTLAAYRTGASWGVGATAMRQMERRYRPPAETFTVLLRPDGSG